MRTSLCYSIEADQIHSILLTEPNLEPDAPFDSGLPPDNEVPGWPLKIPEELPSKGYFGYTKQYVLI